ncbi:STY0301 family protein [Paraburkholderia phytofirmans]|uniref:Lipoprotein n=1 Tax=Paraburkholderia phytofirmans (strain DSM 17436 / LMG 22146 / PsJN) TaxID=398527 RepID=B2TFL8_PARPJ|nr:STY0301 family protein [Paraburkholderia phytofirmans]ACD20026.1 conserved hypothetical protein [Paraburkholderia phytofirmans PsJN]
MWSSKTLCALFYALASGAAVAAPVACPISVLDSGVRHVLNNAALYDGPPDQMTSLVPVRAGRVARWDIDQIDPYLVCKYKSTAKTITLHAKNVSVCAAGMTPFRAHCK